MKNIFTLLVCLVVSTIVKAQSVAINGDGSAPDTSAILDIKSTTKGLLIPRMTLQQRNAIVTPAPGLTVYLTDSKTHSFYNGNGWAAVEDQMGNHSMNKNLKTNSNYISKLGDNMGLRLLDSGGVTLYGNSSNNTTGIVPTTTMDKDGGLVSRGILGVGSNPATGAGWRMVWYPYKASFRVGGLDGAGTQWDDANTGFYSVAMGHNNIASAFGSFAGGDGNTASGTDAFSYGNANLSSGTIGTTIGASCTASGFGSIAMGFTNHATGQGSVAIGYRVNATGDYSVALGHRASSNGHSGCFVLGDESTTDSILSSTNNQFSARYAGGYRLYSNATKTVGVSLAAGGNAWASISDSTKKEKFVKADAEVFLTRLHNLRLGSWNYKGQRDIHYRHYGPMAQEIFSNYGKDRYGIIGCDTLLATADMDGIMMIMLQGLEQRTTAQKLENTTLKTTLANVNTQLATVNNDLTKVTNQLTALKNENDVLKQQLAEVSKMQQQLLAMQKQLTDKQAVVNTNAAAPNSDKTVK